MIDPQLQDDAPQLPNFFVRMGMVLFQPAALFQALAARPAWFPMLAFVSLAIGTAMLFLPGEVWLEMMQQGSPEAAEAMGGIGATVMKFFAALASTAGAFAFTLFIAGVTYVALVFVRGDEANFRQHLSILAHSGIISALGFWFMLPFKSRALDMRLSFSVGTFMPFLPEGYLASVLGAMDIFSVWTAVVAGLGLSLLDARRWAPTAVVTVVVMVLIPAMLTALPTLFG